MRIISPNGTVDIPYELSALQVDKSGAICCKFYNESFRIYLYSSREKALKVMGLIKLAYHIGEKDFQLPKEEEVTV